MGLFGHGKKKLNSSTDKAVFWADPLYAKMPSDEKRFLLKIFQDVTAKSGKVSLDTTAGLIIGFVVKTVASLVAGHYGEKVLVSIWDCGPHLRADLAKLFSAGVLESKVEDARKVIGR